MPVIQQVGRLSLGLILVLGMGDGLSLSYAAGVATISGVISEKGTPISGAEISAGESTNVISDGAGKFSFTAPAGTINVMVRTDQGEYIDDETLTVSEGQAVTLNFDFVPWIMSGVVTENGDALVGATVNVGLNEPVTTDGTGHYRSKVSDLNVNVIAVTATGEVIDSRQVTSPNGAAVTVNLDFQPATVAGVVTENGVPLEGAKVHVYLNKPVVTDASGHYTTRTQAGFHPVIAFTPAGEYINDVMLTLEPDATMSQDFDFRPVVVTGVVKQGAATLPDAQVHIGANVPVTTDGTGAYTTRVQEGTWRAFAQDDSAILGDTLVNTADLNAITVNLQ